jgi:para-aminobenzoate synthetase component 1
VDGQVLPLVRAVPVADPLEALRALARLPYPFLLHSALQDDRARWSFFGADPFEVHRGGDWPAARSAWRRLSRCACREREEPSCVPFTGGAVGYWAYDFGRRLERLPSIAGDDLALPDVVLGFYDVVGAFDHARREAWLFSTGLPCDEPARRRAHAERRLDKFLWSIERRGLAEAPREPAAEAARATSGFTAAAYRDAVEAVREHIRRGDIFQANLSQRWTLEVEDRSPSDFGLDLAGTLARRSPAPYAAYFAAHDHAVVSASPERFLELRGRRVETRPIKGTRPRGADPEDDARQRDALLASAKDRAENVMIVDVLRNDLGRVCETGSVRVPSLCELESFPQVHHLVSTVTGALREDADAIDLLEACFPGGSITGAPKIRAMEILETLEPVRRHVYCGAIGYLDWRGDADWNIAIRSALVTPGAVRFAAGGGVVADSDPTAEYQETLHKAEGLRQALSELVGPVSLEPATVHAG